MLSVGPGLDVGLTDFVSHLHLTALSVLTSAKPKTKKFKVYCHFEINKYKKGITMYLACIFGLFIISLW